MMIRNVLATRSLKLSALDFSLKFNSATPLAASVSCSSFLRSSSFHSTAVSGSAPSVVSPEEALSLYKKRIPASIDDNVTGYYSSVIDSIITDPKGMLLPHVRPQFRVKIWEWRGFGKRARKQWGSSECMQENVVDLEVIDRWPTLLFILPCVSVWSVLHICIKCIHRQLDCHLFNTLITVNTHCISSIRTTTWSTEATVCLIPAI